MRLTQFTDYSLRVLMVLAARPHQRVTVAELAAGLDVSRNHLSKVIHFLGRQGWVSTLRGKGGGLSLGQPAARINLGAVVRAAEGPPRPAECFAVSATHCQIAAGCRLKRVLLDATSAFEAVLSEYTLRDLTLNAEAVSRVFLSVGVAAPARDPIGRRKAQHAVD